MNDPYAAPIADLTLPESDTATYQPRIFALSGRIGRVRYIAYAMLLTLIAVIPYLVFIAMKGALAAEASPLKYVFLLPSYAAGILLATRRLTDVGHSRWWAVLMPIPYVSVIPFLYLVFKPGDEQANAYGPPPCANSRGVVAAAWLLPAVSVLGVVMAVAVPAYQSYSQKAHLAHPAGSKL